MIKRTAFATLIAGSILASAPAMAATQIDFWHAFSGRLGELLQEQVDTFNGSQSD